MDHWGALHRELDRWQAAGQSASLWWRDDDATAPTAALDRLLALAGERNIPVCLAVVPVDAGAPLAARLSGPGANNGADTGAIDVAQHGYAHRNHAPANAKKSELGLGRPLADRLGELANGRRRLARLFGRRLLPVLVPPWNRIDPALVARLGEVGLSGLSTSGARRHANPVAGITQANIHCDPIDWHQGRGFVGTDRALQWLIGHLRARREANDADPTEPTGLLTHHLVMDADAWRFVRRLTQETAAHPGACWLSPEAVFGVNYAGATIGTGR